MAKGGPDALVATLLDYVEQEMADMIPDAQGDSPIEKLLLVALVARCRFGTCEYDGAYVIENTDELARLQGSVTSKSHLLIQTQQQVAGWRVDFLIHAYDHGMPNRMLGRVRRPPGWRKLIVECDGHDFHERTKEQALRDRSRDRAAQLEGYTILRFTGAEIWRDAWGCATQIIDWAVWGI